MNAGSYAAWQEAAALDYDAHPDDAAHAPRRACTHCGFDTTGSRTTRRGLCGACYEYQRRTGQPRPLTRPTTCQFCQASLRGHPYRSVCSTCYMRARRHGYTAADIRAGRLTAADISPQYGPSTAAEWAARAGRYKADRDRLLEIIARGVAEGRPLAAWSELRRVARFCEEQP